MKHPHWATHLSSLEALDILTALGLHAQSRSLRQWKLNVEQLGIDINDMARTSASAISGRHYTCTSREHRRVELAGEAEKAITAKPDALEPGAYNEAGHRHEVETPPQEGEREPEALPRERRRNLGHCG